MQPANGLRFLLAVFCLTSSVAWAEEEVEPTSETIYVPFKPAFVVNYGGPGSRLKFIKAEVSVRADNNDAAAAVRHHMPLIRNNLVMLFSAQTEADMAGQVGREALRQDALGEVREVVVAEQGAEGAEGIVDLYFTSFVLQN